MSDHSMSPLFTWRGAICDSGLPPTTRHVALTLSLHMSERGESCFPSVRTVAAETGLTTRSVTAQLRVLAESGWLRTETRFHESGRQTSNLYYAVIPEGVNDVQGEGEPDSPSLRGEPRSGGRVNETTPQEDVSKEDVVRTSEETALVDDSFEAFWAMYGRVGPRKKAKEGWDRAIKAGATPDEIIGGLEQWVTYWRQPGAARVKWPQGWFSEERWKDDPPFRLRAVENRQSNPGTEALERLRAQRMGQS